MFFKLTSHSPLPQITNNLELSQFVVTWKIQAPKVWCLESLSVKFFVGYLWKQLVFHKKKYLRAATTHPLLYCVDSYKCIGLEITLNRTWQYDINVKEIYRYELRNLDFKNWLSVYQRFEYLTSCLKFKVINKTAPSVRQLKGTRSTVQILEKPLAATGANYGT